MKVPGGPNHITRDQHGGPASHGLLKGNSSIRINDSHPRSPVHLRKSALPRQDLHVGILDGVREGIAT